MLYWHQDIQIDPPNETDTQKIDLHIYGQLTHSTKLQNNLVKKRKAFQQMVLEQLDIHMQKK